MPLRHKPEDAKKRGEASPEGVRSGPGWDTEGHMPRYFGPEGAQESQEGKDDTPTGPDEGWRHGAPEEAGDTEAHRFKFGPEAADSDEDRARGDKDEADPDGS